MLVKRNVFLIFFFFLLPFGLSALTPNADIQSVRDEARKSYAGKKTSRLEFDKNSDKKIDQLMILDAKGNKLYEELDFNLDGEMDDFCFYSNGVLEKELIDSNFDGKIDLWVYLKKGIYVERYERDTDFDGTIDFVKEFGKPRK
jgi:hypothetical protein